MAKPKASSPKPSSPAAPKAAGPDWIGSLKEAAVQPGPYPRWLTVSIKASLVVAVLVTFSQLAAQRSEKAELARLAESASRDAGPLKSGSPRR